MGKGKDRPADPSVGSGAALLIIDMISNMDFRHADEIAAPAEAAARRIKALRAAATRAGLPVIYVNDNFGHWGMERSEEHTSELQSLMRISYAVFCLKKKK